MPVRVTTVLAFLLLCPSLTVAQAPDSLPGQRIRVVARCDPAPGSASDCREGRRPSTYVGRLEARDGDQLRIRQSSTDVELRIPIALIDRLSVGEGTRGHFWKGAGLGLLGGALLGGVIGSSQSFEGSFLFREGQEVVVGAIAGATGGFLVGGIVGAMTRSDRWRSVLVQEGRLRVAPRTDALGFAVSLKL